MFSIWMRIDCTTYRGIVKEQLKPMLLNTYRQIQKLFESYQMKALVCQDPTGPQIVIIR